jgi:hypothetical protein
LDESDKEGFDNPPSLEDKDGQISEEFVNYMEKLINHWYKS